MGADRNPLPLPPLPFQGEGMGGLAGEEHLHGSPSPLGGTRGEGMGGKTTRSPCPLSHKGRGGAVHSPSPLGGGRG